MKAIRKSVSNLLVGTAICVAASGASAIAIYDSIPGVLPPNLPSLGFQATATSEVGDYIRFASGPRNLNSVTVTMSNWALASTYGAQSAGYNHDLTFNIYNAANGPATAGLIASKTISAFVPWRPEADPTCGSAWRAGDGNCYNGLAFNVDFDFSGMGVVLPDEVIFGIAYNTNTWGYQPLGQPGAYESLNVGLSTVAPGTGTDLDGDALFWNTAHQPFLSSGTAGVFGQDTLWAPYSPAVRFDAVPEPGTLALTALALIGLAGRRLRRAA